MMLKKLTVFGLSLLIAGCNPVTKEVNGYSYVPGADSAYIANHVITKDGFLGTTMAKEMAAVRSIDGYPVVYPGGNSEEKFKKVAMPIALAPGKHSLGILADGGTLNRLTTFNLDAKAGEQYSIKVLPIWEERMLVDILTMMTVWIEDSEGNKVVEPVTLERAVAATATPAVIYIPKAK